MRKKLLMAIALLVSGVGNLWAIDEEDYFPSVFIQNVADVLTSPIDANTATFTNSGGDFTLEVSGTSGSEITFPCNKYCTAKYTPSATGTIRFVYIASSEKVFVYEKATGEESFVYKGKATTTAVNYPTIDNTTINAAGNLIGNPDFQVEGTMIESGKTYLGTPWVISDESLYGASAFRQEKHSKSNDYSVTGTDCFVWRTDNNSGSNNGYKGKYFYQKVTLEAYSKYRFRVRSSNVNNAGKADARIGSTPGGKDYSSSDISFEKGDSKVNNGYLSTSETIGANSYFSIYNSFDFNNSSNHACIRIDHIQLFEATKVSAGITGTTGNEKYVTSAVSPICDGNATAAIKNPYFETGGTSNWTNGVSGNGNQYTDAPGGTYLNLYDTSSKDMYQNVTLPAGVYTVKAATRGSEDLEVGFIYAQVGDETIAKADIEALGVINEGTLGKGWKWTEFNFLLVKESTVRIGFYSECGSSKWAGADEFHLTYKGTTAFANMTVKPNKWGTFIAPFDVLIPANVKAYKVNSVAGTSIVREEVTTTIPANTPVVLENTTASTINENFAGTIVSAESLKVGVLKGVYSNAIVKASTETTYNYVLQTQGDKQAFYKVDDAFTATANRCYLTVTGGEVKAFYLDGDETAVSSVKADELQGATIYNLAGQRVSKAQKGVYIINGKKVAVK